MKDMSYIDVAQPGWLLSSAGECLIKKQTTVFYGLQSLVVSTQILIMKSISDICPLPIVGEWIIFFLTYIFFMFVITHVSSLKLKSP